MKLKTFNKANASRANSPGPAISISLKSGVFSINSEAAELLQVAGGGKLLVHQDEESPDQWYLEKTDDETGFTVRDKENPKAASKLYCFNASAISRELFASQKWSGIKSARVTIAAEPTMVGKRKLYGIITHNAKRRE